MKDLFESLFTIVFVFLSTGAFALLVLTVFGFSVDIYTLGVSVAAGALGVFLLFS